MAAVDLNDEQRRQYEAFIANNPGDESRAASALGFDAGNQQASSAFSLAPTTDTGSGYPTGNTDSQSNDQGAPSGPTAYTYKPGDTNTGNPYVDGMINRDKASWEASLKAAGGSLFDPSDYEGLIRQISYKQNAGKDPLEFINQQKAIYDARRAPTASAGGTGGTADQDNRPGIDPGWERNAGGQYVYTGRTQSTPGGLLSPTGVGGAQQPGFGGGAGRDSYNVNAPGSQFSKDPYTALLEDIAKQQLAQLQQPQSNPALDKLLGFLGQRFDSLSTNPGYSPEELALLRTQTLDPIEADRAASQRRVLERTASRGMLPSSGLTELDSQTQDANYDKLRGAAQRDLGINAINRRDQNLAQALTLGQLAGVQIPTIQRQEDQGRRAEMLGLGNALYQLPRQAMMDANAVVNGSGAPPDLFSQAVQLLNANQNTQYQNDAQNAQFWAQLGELFGTLF